MTTTANNTGYFSERWKAKNIITINSLGYREKEFDQDNESNQYRIAVIGDSFAYGQGISVTKRFSNIINSKLSDKYQNIEVLNFSKPGAETVDHIEMLKQHVVPSKPDFVLLQWFVNDVEGGSNITRPKYKRLIPSWALTSALNKHSALYFLVNSAWVNIQTSLGWVDSYEKHLIDHFKDPNTEASINSSKAMNHFINICNKQSIPMGIVLFPVLSDSLKQDYALGFLSDRVLAQCKENNITCLDLRESYSNIEPVSSLWVNGFDHHPGPLANEIAAEKIIDNYSNTWISSKKVYK
ncbi:MAG: SGNH/GDSL hydrolase family protein [Pseudomonadota bacterium]